MVPPEFETRTPAKSENRIYVKDELFRPADR
jgi:hypothetical protein